MPAPPPAPTRFNVVIANILRGPLVELAPRLRQYAAPGAVLLLSGILSEQVPGVTAVYEGLGFGAWSVRTDGQWAMVEGRLLQ